MSSEWNMPRRADQCSACGHVFEIGETFEARLYAAQGDYQRRDFCLNCPAPTDPVAIGTWRTHRPEPAAKRAQAFDREAIYGFFQRFEDAHDPERVQFRFVLALLLWRKKVLKLEQTGAVDGHEVWDFLMPRTGTAHRVTRPALDEDQLERLSSQLEQILAAPPGDLDDLAAGQPREADHE
jgi:hypothetical protein